MTGPAAELLFPPRVLPELGEARGAAWRDLVTAVQKTRSDSPEETALVLMMARLNNCPACSADSFRSSHGCETCSKQALKRFRGPDEELVKMFEAAQLEVNEYLHQPKWRGHPALTSKKG